MRSVETEGTTIDEAIARALELLHIERDRVDVEILESSSRGLLGFGGKRARVRATVRNPLSRGGDAEAAAVSRETPPVAALSIEGAVDAAKSVLTRILEELGVASGVEVTALEDGSWQLGLGGDGAGIVIGRHGQTLDAIEYLLSRIASHHGGGLVRIGLDVEGYRQRRQEALEETARRAAEKARETGRPMTLSPMSPRDRRIVHVALSDQPGITTRSQGEGSFRCVVIIPAGAAGRVRS